MYPFFRFFYLLVVILLTSTLFTFAQNFKIIESTQDHITIEFNFNNLYTISDTSVEGRKYQMIRGDENYFRNPGEPWLPLVNIDLGIPHSANPTYKILRNEKKSYSNKFLMPYPETDPIFEEPDVNNINVEIYSKSQLFPNEIVQLDPTYVVRFAKILPLSISPYQFNPVTRELVFNKKFSIRIDFNASNEFDRISQTDQMTESFLESTVVNFNVAKNWISKPNAIVNSPLNSNGSWYDPNKNYYKLYLKDKGVYRINYNQLVAAGVPLGSNTSIDKLEIFNSGISIPIDLNDTNNDQIFNSNDYIQFVGYPAPASPFATMNLYNLSNVYWFSYESDSTGNIYNDVDGFPQSWSKTLETTRHTIHSEKDSIFERMGYSSTEDIDYWFWGTATAQDRQAVFGFEDRFSEFENRDIDSNYVTLRVQMHGMTNSRYCPTDHKAEIYLTDQFIGDVVWDGQEAQLFEKDFYVSSDSIQIFPTGNRLNVWVRAQNCDDVTNDEIRINWYEFEYWRNLKTKPNNFIFKSHDAGNIRFWTFGWLQDNMKIYIPERNKMISNPNITNDQFNSVLFVDTANVGSEYFLVADNYFLSVDSIVVDKPSNLRDVSNGSDYIIISHPDFFLAAQDLADFRSTNFPDPDIENARTMVVDVNQIYDEFSYGLMDPNSLRDFVKYAFENWQSPAPSYIVLMGDMSHDYRGLLEDGSPNFIPSIQFFAFTYGWTASDNLIVAISGTDVAPDLAIGRMSCETMEEANILNDKVFRYPDDDTKPWKQNNIFLASGLSEDDENNFGFNDASLLLANTYVVPFGYKATYVFRYPTKPEHEPFQGEGPRMRAAINEGASTVNYYGHGGGLQWDLVFLDDDIDLLENGGKLPVIISVTCYTAHFDNQRVFGEHFNLIQNKGSIGFFGSTGLTYWGIGKAINNKIYNEIFVKKNLIIGKAIMNAKNQVPGSGVYGTQVALLSYLGDPALRIAMPILPDFVVTSSDITISPENPVLGDTISVKIYIQNVGRVFPNETVTVELYASSSDTNYQVGSVNRPSFGEKDSVTFTWVPSKGNLFELTAKINETDIIEEEDHSDNVASNFFIVFNLSEPNVLKPVDGFSTDEQTVKFLFSDVGYYINKDLIYSVEIDTSVDFENPIISSPQLVASDPIVEWQAENLSPGIYFWRARIFDGTEYGNWSKIRSFSISNNPKNGYFAYDKVLKTYQSYNVNYSDSAKSLSLNTELLPAKPSNTTFVRDIELTTPLPDSLNLTTITTDGTYLYFGSISFFVANGPSAIYKVGTGYNGTVRGELYGRFSQFYDRIYNSIVYHSDGYIYVPTGNSFEITRINVATEEIDTVDVPPGMLRWENSTTTNGPVYITSDGEYIYNITLFDEQGDAKYTIRTFDPANGWALVKTDMVLTGTSYDGFTGFFVFDGYVYPSESFFSNFMRRIRLNDGFFEEEWLSYVPFQSYFGWCTDWQNNRIYSSVYRSSGFEPKFSEFVGNYVDANGSIVTEPVGPVAWWNNVNYDLYKPSDSGEYQAILLGFNSTSKLWDTLKVNTPTVYPLQNVSAKEYPKLKLSFTLTDSSLGSTEPMELRGVNFDYQQLPDVLFIRDDLQFSPDSVLQGFPITMTFKARNYGPTSIDSLNVSFYLNGEDSVIYSKVVSIPADSVSENISYTINSDQLLFDNEIRAFGTTDQLEYFSFDNLIENNFFVVRDSIKPLFSVTFDGYEIISGDIVSAKPDVKIILEDNSPLPLDTSFFTIVYNNKPLYFAQEELNYQYTPYPNSKSEIHWTPELPDGKHKLEILAKDASGNFFDSTSSRTTFFVFNESDLTDVYNYPNPFNNETSFTFALRGTEIPEEVKIKVYTIAGRLIKDFKISVTDLTIGFNKVYWNGKDQDGDDIANGVYLYKVIAKFPDKTKSVTQKLARVR
jgi:Peptidase family C25/Propeptide_C25/CARDB